MARRYYGTKPLSHREMVKKFGKKHADEVFRQMREAENEPLPPSGGWCNSCERYDCGHHVFAGMVISRAEDERIVYGHPSSKHNLLG